MDDLESPPRLAASCRAREVELKPGKSVLVLGDEAQESSLFRAVSELWPWGVPDASPARTVNATVQGRERHCGDRLRAGERIAPARDLFEEFFP